jgi:putative tricarboxylic transport membrane protein
MSDRIFSGILLVVAVFYAAAAYLLEVPFQYEPLGPKAWPILLAILLVICAVLVFLRPEREPAWPVGRGMVAALVLTVGLVLYAVLFEPLGFMVTTTVVCAGFALMLGARWLPAVLFGLLMGVPGYYVWTDILQLNLPLGGIFH